MSIEWQCALTDAVNAVGVAINSVMQTRWCRSRLVREAQHAACAAGDVQPLVPSFGTVT